MTNTETKVFLFAQIQVSIPFAEFPWTSINADMKKIPGLRSKTWLSGLGTDTIGGFYEFESAETARAYADGALSGYAKAAGGTLSVQLFSGAAVAEASQDMKSPYFTG